MNRDQSPGESGDISKNDGLSDNGVMSTAPESQAVNNAAPGPQALRSGRGCLIPGRRWLLVLATFLIVELLVLGGVFERTELNLYDAWFRLSGAHDPGSQVVILAMDDPSIQKLGPLPWPRSVIAGLLDKLGEARVVGFDLVFDLPSKPQDDQALAEAIARQGRVVLANRFMFEKATNGKIVEALSVPLPEFMKGAAGLGFINMPTDIDNVVRHVTLVDVNEFHMPFPALGLAVGLAATNVSPGTLKLAKDMLSAGGQSIPVDRLNMALPGFWGPQGAFKTYSCIDVLDGKVPAQALSGKIILIGPESPVYDDYYSTPYTSSNLVLAGTLPTPGVEIHASVVQSFLDGTWYRRLPAVPNLVILFLIGLGAAMILTRRSPWQGLLLLLGMAAAVSGIAFLLWRYDRLWINLAAPLALVILNYGSITAADFLQSELDRRRTRAMFSRYVSPAVVDEIMKDPARVALGGERQLVTIMFCDIRGFTAYSENKQPEAVVQRLNQYLTVMTRLILKAGGTLDKYLGDGLMAVFGAPIPFQDHIQRAIRTAVAIQEEIRQLNESWVARGEIPLQIGIGINSGWAVMGNVGSPDRMDYTAIGEDVNLASRVEGLTKTFDVLIIVSERSVQLLDEELRRNLGLKYVGQAEVKGFTLPVGVYTVGDYRLDR